MLARSSDNQKKHGRPRVTTESANFGSNVKTEPDMSRSVSLFLIILLLSCEDNDRPTANGSVAIGAFMCGKKPAEMLWLKDLITKAKTDMSQNGNIYRGFYDGEVIFIHQPMIMSCLACIVYNCDGKKLDPATLDHEKLRLNMSAENLVYKAY